jgi:nucleoside diphosphate kinase
MKTNKSAIANLFAAAGLTIAAKAMLAVAKSLEAASHLPSQEEERFLLLLEKGLNLYSVDALLAASQAISKLKEDDQNL